MQHSCADCSGVCSEKVLVRLLSTPGVPVPWGPVATLAVNLANLQRNLPQELFAAAICLKNCLQSQFASRTVCSRNWPQELFAAAICLKNCLQQQFASRTVCSRNLPQELFAAEICLKNCLQSQFASRTVCSRNLPQELFAAAICLKNCLLSQFASRTVCSRNLPQELFAAAIGSVILFVSNYCGNWFRIQATTLKYLRTSSSQLLFFYVTIYFQ